MKPSLSEIEKEDLKAKILVSKEEAAKQLNVSCPTLYRWEKTGYLIPVRCGRKVLYRQLDIDNLPK